jgi:predicted RNA-binding protein
LFSDLSSEAITELAQSAKRQGSSRQLLEATAALDPVLADFLYIVDHKLAAAGYQQAEAGTVNATPLNTWHSFGRPEIVGLQERMCRWVASNDTFLILPCSRHRPYGESRTHKRLAADLAAVGQPKANATRVVVTALGVVPEPFWSEPIVMGYDAGAVDLWRVFQLLRQFFLANPGRLVVDCLSFKPYSQMLATLHSLNQIGCLLRPLKLRWRSFCVDLK